MNLSEIQKMVQDSIENGATTVEQVHKQIANMPLEALAKFGPLEGAAQGVRDFNERSIGGIYELIRNINQKAGEFAQEQLKNIDPSAP